MHIIELKIIQEVELVLKSKQFKTICNASNKGVSHSVIINNRTIVVEPEAPISGMTLFEENGFVLGKEAFTSKEELIKTLLQEIYRLETSNIGKTGKATQEIVAEETKAAHAFAEKSFFILLQQMRRNGLETT